MATRKQCLEYVANTAGGATVENFKEDWEPVGQMAWDDLANKGLAEVNDAGRITLTEAGVQELQHLRSK